MEKIVPADGPSRDESDSSPQSDLQSSTELEPPSSGFFTKLRGIFGAQETNNTLKEALQEVLDEHDDHEQCMAPEEKRIFSNLIDFGDVEVSDLMTPQSDISAVELQTNLQDLRDLLIDSRHTRLPVYDETIDSIKGFIHVKDLLPYLGNDSQTFHLKDIIREVVFVPEAMKVSDLLLKMRISGTHIAIVVDEYGGTDGLVTLEDMFEEIVGDIQDEHDDPEENRPLRWSKKSTVVVDAKTRLSELEEELAIDLEPDDEEDDYDTIGGLVFSQLGRVPARGEKTTHKGGVEIEVLDADERRIKTVRLTRASKTVQEVA